MKILEIFERVNLKSPIEHRKFFDFYNDTISELTAICDKFLFQEDTEFEPVKSFDDESVVLYLYNDAIAENINFLNTNNETGKSEFLRKAQNAYLYYWNEDAKKHNHIKNEGW